MSDIKTYPEMDINIKQMLRFNNEDPVSLYAAQRIEELENQVDVLTTTVNMYVTPYYDKRNELAQVKARASVIQEALEEVCGYLPVVLPSESAEKIKEALSSTAGQDLLDRMKALEEENNKLKNGLKLIIDGSEINDSDHCITDPVKIARSILGGDPSCTAAQE